MSSDIQRPATRSQPSRKSKRSWRKNIDLDEIEQGLELHREELITHGDTLENVKSDDLFFIDDEEDQKITKKMKKDNVKVLKSTEILNATSKIPALQTERSQKKKNKNKIQGVDKKQIQKLMRLAGRVQGVNTTQALVEQQGIVTTKAYDVWSDGDDSKTKSSSKGNKKSKPEVPEILKKFSGISYTPATVMPSTLKEAPIKIREVEKMPHEGKSYNPSFDSWKNLINLEFSKELPKEEQRQKLLEHQEKIQYLIETLESNEIDDDSKCQSTQQ
ncbi:unnamed protein product [Ambrosiozyma monospora]|uniref:Ribosome biogenesis protein NOP53 n=1 Tax=Ambrosiozyma monospora TaxID=43982 RepID=A0A9W6YTT4_AMBMO|nr:unnamed protein product [Ambrosiozyma monospora]